MHNQRIKTNLNSYSNTSYQPGSRLKRILWYFVNSFVFKSHLFPFQKFKRALLRLFGAKIGKGVILKPGLNIKYPWFLTVGDFCWIGEDVWIDNLAKVTLERNVCLSQGAFLLTGSHNYKESAFDLVLKPIFIEEGAWIGAKAIVCQGVKVQSHAILSVGSIATKDLEPYSIYKGNPAIKIKERKLFNEG